ncbi:MAG TPA: NAD(P)/FAD-dependent oxidoreductase [Flavisolibacter sp.]|jgi:kynurenine 3-monooxygenase
MDKQVVIIGAGLVGSLLSIYLARKGYKVSVYERRGDMRRMEVEAGRSINLALSDRGIRALEEVGIAKEVLSIAIPMHGRFIHNLDGSTAFQPYGKQGQYINSVSRRDLNCKLMDLAEKEGIRFFFNHKCSHIDWKKNEVFFETITDERQPTTGEGTTGKGRPLTEETGGHQSSVIGHPPSGHRSSVVADLIFGSDGAYSAARLSHMLQHDQFEYHQYYIDCGYKELTIPAGPDGSFLLEKNALHIWPRKNYMLIALPNPDGSFTGTLFFPFHGQLSFEKLTEREQVDEFFETTFPDVVPLIPDLPEQFFSHPTSSLVTVKCFPWIREDKFCLIGDAAHAIVPFFGQGMNAGFEDCSVLNTLMEKHGSDWTAILNEFQGLRKPDADAIADLAVNNFIEMREKTADPKFLLQKKIEARLHEHHPDKWIPAYSQVTFSPHIRYSEALRNSQRQEAIMQEVMRNSDIEHNWDNPTVEEMILSRLGEV